MLRFKLVTILAVMALATLVAAQAPPGGSQAGQPNAPLLEITQPPADAKLAQSFVSVEYQITNPTIAAAGSPNFRVKLDNQDPVLTASTSQNFTGLTPGRHTVTVQLVDANNAPVAGAAATVRFTILNPQSGFAAMILPSGGSPLPLLSVVGFGVLLGGLVSAMRTRAH